MLYKHVKTIMGRQNLKKIVSNFCFLGQGAVTYLVGGGGAVIYLVGWGGAVTYLVGGLLPIWLVGRSHYLSG